MISDMQTANEKQHDDNKFMKEKQKNWNETVGKDDRIGQWAQIGRKKGSEWWVAAMTDWSRRVVEVPTAFLGSGAWEATLWADGRNADKVGTDYRKTTAAVAAGEPLRL